MKKILTLLSILLVLFVSYVNAGPVLTQEVIHDGMLNGVNGVFKELTGQNDQAHEENCKKEYKKLQKRNSQLLQKEQSDNIKLKRIASMNNIPYEEAKIDHLAIRKNGKCSIEYWDYLKSTSHEISELSKENNKIKIMLAKRNINYTPMLKTTAVMPTEYKTKDIKNDEREKAKEDLKKQMGF